jgi:type I restriction enzyme M protein
VSREQERQALHSAIWKIANNLRGSVGGWDFKDYVLGFLFYRFISENLCAYLNQRERKAGDKAFDYQKFDDKTAENARKTTIEEKGFFILPSELFENMRIKAKTDPNLNTTLADIFKNIESSAAQSAAENAFKGLFDDIDLNSKKLGATVAKRNELLSKIMDAIGGLDFGDFKDNSIDAFGDAYEYLISMYASNAGNKGGEFFTPQEVSELLAEIAVFGKTKVKKVYDPACGSGSLLLKFAKTLGKENVTQGFFGQESNITTYNLCRMNMFLHDINFAEFNIAHGDTLREPKHRGCEPFEAIVSNPPYGIKWIGKDDPTLINDPRFAPAGILAPKNNADFAFIMHILSSLATNGTAAIVCFPGILYRTNSKAEPEIRKYLIDNNYIDSIIQTPANLFFGTSISTSIVVLKRSKADNAVLFINAEKMSVHSGNKEKLSAENIEHILAAWTARKNKKHFSRLVRNEEIAKGDYNLAVSTFVEAEDSREIVDIAKLNAEIAEIVKRENALRREIDKIVADIESGTKKGAER